MRCVIIGAAPIKNYERISSYLKKDDFIIVCDAGLNHTEKLNVIPNLIVGDFDSTKNPESKKIETIVLPREKDDTDSVYALKTAFSRGFSDFLFIGMIGDRFDHSLANLSLLLRCHEKNFHALMADDFSDMELVSKNEVEISDTCNFFSLIPISGTAEGITIKDAKFPLENGKITPENAQLGVSNEVLSGKSAKVSVQKGILLLTKIYTA